MRNGLCPVHLYINIAFLIDDVSKQIQPTASCQARRDKLVADVCEADISIRSREMRNSSIDISILSSSCMNVIQHVQPTASDRAR
jgi:hypothetical protein